MKRKTLTLLIILSSFIACENNAIIDLIDHRINPKISRNGLVHWWNFNDASVTDSIGGITGTLTAMTVSKMPDRQGTDGYSITSTGTTTAEYISMGNGASLDTDPITIAFWYYPVSVLVQTVIGKILTSTCNSGYQLNLSAVGALTYETADSSCNAINNTGITLNYNTWYYIIITNDIANNGINSVQITEYGQSSLGTTGSQSSAKIITTSQLFSVRPGAGRIDDMTVYNRVLSDEEKLENFRSVEQ